MRKVGLTVGMMYALTLASQVGIGTTSVDGLLHLDNGTSDSDLILEKDAGTNTSLIFHNAGVEKANISFNSSEEIKFENDESDADVVFKVNDGGVDTEVMRIDASASSIGVGTTTPSKSLHIYHNISNGGITIDKDDASSRKSAFSWANQGTFIMGLGTDNANANAQDFYLYHADLGNIWFFDSQGDMGINDDTPDHRLVVGTNTASMVARFWNDGNSGNHYGIRTQSGADGGSASGFVTSLVFFDGDGTEVGGMNAFNGSVGIYTQSDRRLKTNIEDTRWKGLKTINNLKVVDFQWKKGKGDWVTGFIAQQVEKHYSPGVVSPSESGDKYYTLSHERFVPILTRALQEENQKILDLEKKLNGELAELESKIKKMEIMLEEDQKLTAK